MSTVPTRYTLERDVEHGQDVDVIEGQLLAEAAGVIYSLQHSEVDVHVLSAPKASHSISIKPGYSTGQVEMQDREMSVEEWDKLYEHIPHDRHVRVNFVVA